MATLGDLLRPDAVSLVVAFGLDLAFGDPEYRLHPVRLIGGLLQRSERRLRRHGLDGRGSGVMLCVILLASSIGALLGAVWLASLAGARVAWAVHVLVLYTMLAFGDLVRHVWRIDAAVRRDDLDAARSATARLVSRDTLVMDAAACRRAGVESLSENLTDGFVSAVFWYGLLGLPGIVAFKVISTMDSMVGYRSARYLHFGWCGARLDDLMNYLPARMTWLLTVLVAAMLPGFSAQGAWRIGLSQHAHLLGPNSGWSEAGAAGALRRRIVGPIWLNGVRVTDLWIGDPADPQLSTADDVRRAIVLSTLVAGTTVILAVVVMIAIG